MPSYEDWITSLRLSWMGPRGRAILGGFAATLGDKTIAWAKQALREHLPQYASSAALALIASERQLDPGPTETTTALALRLTQAFAQWRLAGTALGLLIALRNAEFYGAVLVQQNGRAYSLVGVPDLTAPEASLAIASLGGNVRLPGVPPWWTIDDDTTFCSRFLVLFPAPNTVNLGDATELARIRKVIAKWRPAKATCAGIVVVASGRLWGWPITTWGSGSTWGGSAVTYAA